MRILGISPFHDSSVAVYCDGKIESFYKEERYSRIKRDKHPFKSLDLVKQEGKKIDLAVICSPTNGDASLYAYADMLKKSLGAEAVIDMSENHHLQHASLAFYNSGFKKSLVIVVDRNGSIIGNNFRESETVFVAEYPHTFTEIYKNYWYTNKDMNAESYKILQEKYKNTQTVATVGSMQGIVKVYESATSLIGQQALENGKTMGLASYGKDIKNFPNLFVELGIGDDKLFNHFYDKWGDYVCGYVDHEEEVIDQVHPNHYKFYADYAYQVQKQTQEAVLSLIKKSIAHTGIKDVCITGGYGLNVIANQYYLESLPDVNFYFEPLADDSGNSLGGAMYQYRYYTRDMQVYPIKNTFFHGKKYNVSKIKGEKCTYETIANDLAKGKSVAIYEGYAEAGPRALGNRSILFDARNPDAKNLINKVKNREWYRPFAAAVLEEDASLYFDMIVPTSPYMTVSFNANQYAIENIPGVIHVDGTCRIQTVSEENKNLYSLLKEFKKATGHGVLLNTSFNLAGEPLVETPEEALSVLDRSELSLVWFPEIGKYVKK